MVQIFNATNNTDGFPTVQPYVEYTWSTLGVSSVLLLLLFLITFLGVFIYRRYKTIDLHIVLPQIIKQDGKGTSDSGFNHKSCKKRRWSKSKDSTAQNPIEEINESWHLYTSIDPKDMKDKKMCTLDSELVINAHNTIQYNIEEFAYKFFLFNVVINPACPVHGFEYDESQYAPKWDLFKTFNSIDERTNIKKFDSKRCEVPSPLIDFSLSHLGSVLTDQIINTCVDDGWLSALALFNKNDQYNDNSETSELHKTSIELRPKVKLGIDSIMTTNGDVNEKQLYRNTDESVRKENACKGDPGESLCRAQYISVGIDYGDKSLETDILKNPWQILQPITKEGGVLKTDYSSVQLYFPAEAVETRIYISGSVLVDIPALRKIFRLKESEVIVAPVVEYLLEEKEALNKHACITVPHCVRRFQHKIQVRWFRYDHLQNRIELYSVPYKKLADKESSFQEMYWTCNKKDTLTIYTTHFSGFVCTTCKTNVDCEINAYLFRRFDTINSILSLSLLLHLAGPLSRILDFEKDMKERMKEKNMDLLVYKEVELHNDKKGILQFEIELIHDSENLWQHVERQNGRLMYNIQQEFSLERMVRCCENHMIHYDVDWYLHCKSAVPPACTACIDVTHIIDTEFVKTTMHAAIQPPTQTVSKEETQTKKLLQFLVNHLGSSGCNKLKQIVIFFRNEDLRESDSVTDNEYTTLESIFIRIGLNGFCRKLQQILRTVDELEFLLELERLYPSYFERDDVKEIIPPTYSRIYMRSLENDSNLKHFRAKGSVTTTS